MSVGTQRLRDDADRLRAGAIAKREDPKVVDAALEVRVCLPEVENSFAQRRCLTRLSRDIPVDSRYNTENDDTHGNGNGQDHR